jgi:tRNA modification GTPase
MKKRAVQIQQNLKKLIDSASYGRILREGLKTAIIGRPNVGKSSLLNALLEHDRAIVTEIPGTTRDVIEEYLNIGGVPVKIMDTAGIREVKGIAEKEGVKRSIKAMEDADMVLLVLDGSEDLHETDMELIEKSALKNTIFVINKVDLPQKIKIRKIPPSPPLPKGGTSESPLCKRGAVLPLPQSIATGSGDFVNISTKKGTGLDELKNKITERILAGHVETGANIVTNVRHVRALEKTLSSVNLFISKLAKKTSAEFLAIELRDALDSIGEIIGITTPDDILNRIFSNFCIGK